jgi:hypothetical protein
MLADVAERLWGFKLFGMRAPSGKRPAWSGIALGGNNAASWPVPESLAGRVIGRKTGTRFFLITLWHFLFVHHFLRKSG